MEYFFTEDAYAPFSGENFSYWRYAPPSGQSIEKFLPFSGALAEHPIYFKEINECGDLLFGGAPFTPRFEKCNWNAPDEGCYRKLRISFLLAINVNKCLAYLWVMVWTAQNEEPYCNPINNNLPIIYSPYAEGSSGGAALLNFGCPLNMFFIQQFHQCAYNGSGFYVNYGATGLGETTFLVTE